MLGLLVLAVPVERQAQGVGPCADPNSSQALTIKSRLNSMVSQIDTIAAHERTRFDLPSLAANQVTIISDTTACRTASLAYDSVASLTPIDKPALVLALGTRRIVVKQYRLGEWLLAVLFNQDFTIMLNRFGL
jgi:hypothetical protein